MTSLPPGLIETAVSVGEIVWVNVILSGDNAVVIAMACRGLPPERRRTGMMIGAAVAIVLRIAFTAAVAALLTTPFVKLGGGLLLLWIGAHLVVDDDPAESAHASERLWGAIRTIAVADAVMSLDNVLATAAVANGSPVLLVLGLGISVPLIVAGSAVILEILDKVPALVWAGAVLLGWLAGEMIATDPFLVTQVGAARVHDASIPASIAGVALVIAGGLLLRWRGRRQGAA